jgi:hypothetical protein
MLERVYQRGLIQELKRRFPGCVILKNDSSYLQGIPDLTVLSGTSWAMLETKVSEDAHHQPNQEYYVELLNEMSFAAFIYPENEEDVLRELQQTFTKPRR